FAYNIPAQTVRGQVISGDALYLRDAGDPGYEETWGVSLSQPSIVKLAALSELYGLEDCTAELLCKYRKELEGLIDVTHSLSLLTPQLQGKNVSFAEYGEAFEKNPRGWFPSAPTPQALPEEVTSGVRVSPESEPEQIAHLQRQLEEWQAFWPEQIDRLERQLE